MAMGMGFKAAAGSVARKEGVGMKAADRIIGAGKAKASAGARMKNPNLNKMGGKKSGASTMAANMSDGY